MVRDGVRRVLGLRRKAKRKVLPFALIGGALLPALFFVALGVVLGELADAAVLFGHPQYFDLTGSMALVFVALAAGELLIPDRASGTLQVYASRPLTTIDYLVARGVALATVVVGFLWLPHVVLFAGRAWVSSRGFGSYVAGEWEVLATTLLASIVYFVGYAPFAFAVASATRRASLAAGAFLGIVTISGPSALALVDAGYPSVGLLALQHHPGYVKDWIMGSSTREWIPEAAGFGAEMSLLMIVLVAAGSWLVVLFRQRRAS